MKGKAYSIIYREFSVSTCKPHQSEIRLNIPCDFYFQVELTFAAPRLIT